MASSDITKEREEVMELHAQLSAAQERSRASMHLAATVAETVNALANRAAEVATHAYVLQESVEQLTLRAERIKRELHYVQKEAEEGTLDVGAARVLSRQLKDIAKTLDLQIDAEIDDELGQMADDG